MNNWTEFIGYVGSFLTSITFIPQVYKSWKSKSVGDLSVWMILIVITSTIVWLVYGFGINSGPVISANIVVLTLSLVLFYFKLTFKKQ
jgi:MtN3 and saliva related transmembrane protein